MSEHDSPIVSVPDLVLVRDPRGSLVHVRQRQSNECVGCVEAGLFEILRALILDEAEKATPGRLGGLPGVGSVGC